ncbi:MAG: PAS-domain containing protein [Planctomycetota bacterium]|nr:PAS-domain containing protein [Planctomycetota bacterium]
MSDLSLDMKISDSVLLSIQEGVTIYDQQFRLIAWNESYCKLGFVPRERLREGMPLAEILEYCVESGVLGEDNPHELAARRLKEIRCGEAPEVEDVCKPGGGVVEVRRYFLPNIGVAVVFSDVTEARGMAAKAQQHDQLDVVAKMSAGFCHDFNNILQAIMGHLQLAKRSGAHEHLQSALDATISGADLSKSMLALARSQTGSHDLPQTQHEFDAITSIKRTVGWLKRVIRPQVSIETDLAANRTTLTACEGRFATALANLIINASDATVAKGKVSIGLRDAPAQEGMLQITVADHGVGMTEKMLRRVQQPFFTTKGSDGTGLGLFEVQSFVESVGGEFKLTSELRKGTTATMLLPADSTVPRSLNSPAAAGLFPDLDPEHASKPKRGRVLIVEDRAAVRSTLQQTLEQAGFQTVSVVSVECAQVMIDGLPTDFLDVVVSDVILPGQSGIEFAHWLFHHVPHLPIALLSGTPVENAHSLPDQTLILQKPISPEQLLSYLATLLAQRRLAKGA